MRFQVDDFTVDMHVTHSFRTHYPQSLSLSRVQSLPVSGLRAGGGGHHQHHAGSTTALNLRLHDSTGGGGSGTHISEVDSDTGSDLSYVKVGSDVAATRQVREIQTDTERERAASQTDRWCAPPDTGVWCRRPGGDSPTWVP